MFRCVSATRRHSCLPNNGLRRVSSESTRNRASPSGRIRGKDEGERMKDEGGRESEVGGRRSWRVVRSLVERRLLGEKGCLGEMAVMIPLGEGPTAEKWDPDDQKDVAPCDGAAPQDLVRRGLSAVRSRLGPTRQTSRGPQGKPHLRVPHAARGPGRSAREHESRLRADFAL
jgi:hypothetical protein